jgi:hypothetical protein
MEHWSGNPLSLVQYMVCVSLHKPPMDLIIERGWFDVMRLMRARGAIWPPQALLLVTLQDLDRMHDDFCPMERLRDVLAVCERKFDDSLMYWLYNHSVPEVRMGDDYGDTR